MQVVYLGSDCRKHCVGEGSEAEKEPIAGALVAGDDCAELGLRPGGGPLRDCQATNSSVERCSCGVNNPALLANTSRRERMPPGRGAPPLCVGHP